MTETPEIIQRLDGPTKAALRWAWSVSMNRAKPTTTIDSMDLLAGIMLGDLRGNPVRQLLDHFSISLGSVLSKEFEVKLSSDKLFSTMNSLPIDKLPSLDKETTEIFTKLDHFGKDGASVRTSTRELFGAILAQPETKACRAIRRQLGARGINPDRILASYPHYLAGRETYPEHLRSNFPDRKVPLVLPGYHADRVHPAVASSSDIVGDLIGIDAEIESFAQLFTTTTLDPPLAVGLFGDWGTGKSFFIQELQRSIERLTTQARVPVERGQDTPFLRNVAQIEFNAWQYVDDNILASLLEHIFRNLRIKNDDEDDLLAERQKYWIRKIEHVEARKNSCKQERVLLNEKRMAAADRVAERKLAKDRAGLELEQRRHEDPLSNWRVKEDLLQIRELLDKSGFSPTSTAASELANELRDARKSMEGIRAVLLPISSTNFRYLFTVVLLMAIVPTSAILISSISKEWLINLSTTGTGVLVAISGYLRFAKKLARKACEGIHVAQERLSELEEESRAKLTAEIKEAAQRLADLELAYVNALNQEEELAREIENLENSLIQETPNRVLQDFISGRIHSDDYRSRLGIPALVRRDLERLSRLVAEHRRTVTSEVDELAIERIVLYIDDLDRCTPDVVVKLLETVHLLLSFPLFIVVVAVDYEWLKSSLESYYDQFHGGKSRPVDYLDKIFQIPYWIPAIRQESARRMTRRLLTKPEPGDSAHETYAYEEGPATEGSLREFRNVVMSFNRDDMIEPHQSSAKTMEFTGKEVKQAEWVATIAGRTPRSIKKFANILRIVLATGRMRGWRVPPEGQLIVLSALQVGLPTVAEYVMSQSKRATEPLHLIDIPLPKKGISAEADRDFDLFSTWLNESPSMAKIDMSGLDEWAEHIARFRSPAASRSD
ncbi:P-loop NTPase fold protein [Amycolatopsis panacis]|uniref:KAP NTPase domain-containing protein n=1 Tax=Amycolatopsis panacis TaxID=2340917 RepID=A0A419I0B7_9PSEU|nr:P-loop NTPase fold protein [Amycolatopsis panacis]RJQ83093.1 hypothetical protein D5S19_20750 [Amycolatopsis panacis]